MRALPPGAAAAGGDGLGFRVFPNPQWRPTSVARQLAARVGRAGEGSAEVRSLS